MSKIKVMSETLANKIAAGEVVEKCSSVVKELVENSIDANSTEICITLNDGGLKLIKVDDNGIGMDETDALLAFQRHATSKITRDDDLFFIGTLGFRGEALPSIASVSEVVLKTSTGDVGTLIHIKGGKLIKKEAADAKKGTSITITNLFYNTPARLKYLKTEASELANCVSLIEKEALANSNIAFTLINNDRILVKTSGSNNLHKTIHEIYGLNVSSKMIEIKETSDDFDIYGYICKPEVLKSNRNHMITIVNDRVVRNNELNRTINDAYYTYKPDIKYPIVVIKIDTDPTLIDVNIHPTKQDIKISKMDVLSDMLFKSIKNALYKNLLIPDATSRLPEEYNEIKEEILKNVVEEQSATYEQEYVQTELNLSPIVNEEKETIITNKEMKELVLYPVGVAHGTYIIAENDEGVYLIDQHAAQERINYEKVLKGLKEKKINKIQLLIPITIELSASEYLNLKTNFEYLQQLGFDIEEFGLNTVVIKAHPSWLIEGYEEENIRRIIDIVITDKKKFDPIKFNDHIAATIACKMSIKANMRISHEAQEELLQELCQCDNPYNCPHGRPTIIKFTIYDLERMFKRVMN
jgi:DNA mismatch repair protein MutL